MRAGPSFLVAALLAASVARGQSSDSPAKSDATGSDATTDSTAAPLEARSAPVHARHTYTLKECLGFAEHNYPKIHEAAAQLSRMRAQVWEAKTAPFSLFTASAGVALAPTLAGTALYSPNTDATITSSMALAWRVGIEGAVPLWTFGKITNAIDAAEAQTKVGEQNVRKAKNEVRLSVRQAYYGTLLSRDAQALLNEALSRVNQYLPRVEEKVATGDGDDVQLLKLKIHRAELQARLSEAQKQERIALSSLRFLTGMGPSLDVPDEPLRKVPHTLGPIAQYLTAARLFRPEINMAHAGILARRALVNLERARYFPDIAVGLSASRSYAPEVSDQLNPFVRDDANYTRYGIGLVMTWNLDFLPRMARVAQAEAQLEEIRATEQYALGGV
ncbi:MAG TPA: TolC family protein, partial [Polyangiaceae bacterium]|nr:TolC family protein [Polyangiaceae bacterium]